MPFKSDKQKRWMYANKPKMAKEWSAKENEEGVDKIDLSKWKEYPAEDVMKAVYRQYGKELPSVDSLDWEMSWDKKVRPWLKRKFPADMGDEGSFNEAVSKLIKQYNA